MSYVEGPKSRVSSIIPALAPAENISVRFKPGCVQCGNLLETLDLKKTNFSGKCFNCEHWINDDDEWFEDLED
jgi:hypothetical protein